MVDKKVFHEFLGEVKGIEKQKKKYEKAARIKKGKREPFPYWDEIFMAIMMIMTFSFFIVFMILVKY